VAITVTCRIVAPARRIAANRCSRRAADSRIAAPMNTRTGKKSTRARTARIVWSPVVPAVSGPPSLDDETRLVILPARRLRQGLSALTDHNDEVIG